MTRPAVVPVLAEDDPVVATERAYLGALLAVETITEKDLEARPSDFSDERHQVVYAAVLAVHGKGEGVDLLTVGAELRRRGRLEKAGGVTYISSLTDAAGDGRAPSFYVPTLLRETKRRSLGKDLEEATANLQTGADPVDVVANVGAALARVEEQPAALEWMEPPKGDDVPAIEGAAFHGLAGDFVRLVEPHTEADPIALLLQLLVFFGNAVGRGPFMRVGATRHRAVENLGLVGETGKGRKGTAADEVRRPFALIEDPWIGRFTTGLSSGEGLIWEVRDPITKKEPLREGKGRGGEVTGYQTVTIDEGEADKRAQILESEFGKVLRVMERDGNTLSAVTRELWDCKETVRIMTKNAPAKATGAHVSIVGHITGDELLRYLDRTETANGWANRFLWPIVRRSKELPDGGNLPDESLRPFCVVLRSALHDARSIGEMRRSPEAAAVWRLVYGPLSAGKPGLFGAVTGRAEAHVLRLSMIYALTDGSAEITVPHLEAALAVWTYCEDSARAIFGSSLGDPEADEILRGLLASENGLTRTEIRDLLGRHSSAARVSRALDLLARHGLARGRKEGTAGRPVERWFRMGRARAISDRSDKSPSGTVGGTRDGDLLSLKSLIAHGGPE